MKETRLLRVEFCPDATQRYLNHTDWNTPLHHIQMWNIFSETQNYFNCSHLVIEKYIMTAMAEIKNNIEMKRIVVCPDNGYRIFGELRGWMAEYPAIAIGSVRVVFARNRLSRPRHSWSERSCVARDLAKLVYLLRSLGAFFWLLRFYIITLCKRNRLLPANAENLVFIHHNLSLVNFDY